MRLLFITGLGVILLGSAVVLRLKTHGRESAAHLEMIKAGSREPLGSLFDGLEPIAHFTKSNWRGPETSSDRVQSGDSFLWKVGTFLGVVGTVHAQQNCGFSCAGHWVQIEQWNCPCGTPPQLVDVGVDSGSNYCAGAMSESFPSCTNDGCGAGYCGEQLCPSC